MSVPAEFRGGQFLSSSTNPPDLTAGTPMTRARRSPGVRLYSLALLLVCLTSTAAQAHPHVWVTMTTELLYAPDGAVTGVRHNWKFDDMFSAYATTGIQAKVKGQFTRAELQPLAQVNVEALKEYAYFTYAQIDGKKQKDAFLAPADYWLDYDPKATVLILHFTLPFKQPVKAKRLVVEIYDPEFFIDFAFADNNPVALVNAPAQCAATYEKPHDQFFSAQTLNQSFVPNEAFIGMGASFANRISVQCR
jgi:ABC-type uncharacterized transport system substrate-binding protein